MGFPFLFSFSCSPLLVGEEKGRCGNCLRAKFSILEEQWPEDRKSTGSLNLSVFARGPETLGRRVGPFSLTLPHYRILNAYVVLGLVAMGG